MRWDHRWAAMAATGMLGVCSAAGAHAAGAIIKTLPTGAVMTYAGGTLELNLVRANVLRVHFLPYGRATPKALVISPHAPHAAATPVSVRQQGDQIILKSGSMRVVVDRSAGTLSVYRPGASAPVLTQHGLRLLGRDTFAVRFRPRNAALYGVHGFNSFQSARSGMLRMGRQFATAGWEGDAGAPLVWSTSGFALLVDSQKTRFDLGPGFIKVLRETRPDLDYYLILGNPPRIFSTLDVLTGHAPMFPKWSFGFINSQWGINEGELLRIVHEYRKLHIPINAFALDFDWKAWGQNNYGEFRWNTKKFPDGPSGKLGRELAAQGIHLIGIMKPRIFLDTVEGRYCTKHHLFLPGEKPSLDYWVHKPTRTLDFEKAATRKFFFNATLRHSFASGIVGWWNDEADETGNDRQFFNMERALYDGQRKYFPKQRVWSLNRNFWLGAQRYAYGLWSGDIKSGFKSMAAQRQRMLSAIDVGEMWWGMDGGGFSGHPSGQNYARWLEFDAFAPITRVHGSYLQRRQPWIYGQTAARAATAALDLRYRLFPYIYSLAWHEHRTGIGLVRPLYFSWPHDPHVRNDYSAWMFGPSLLVSPVVGRNQRVKNLYLPPGTWTNFFTGKVYRGNRVVRLKLDYKTFADIPLFVRQGAIIPTQPLMQYIGQHPVTKLTVEVFPASKASHFDYYDDDGETYAYQHGDYFLQRLGTQAHARTVRLTLGAVHGTYKPALRRYLFVVHRVQARAVTVEGRALKPAAGLVALSGCRTVCWARGHNRAGALTFVDVPAGQPYHVSIEKIRRASGPNSN